MDIEKRMFRYGSAKTFKEFSIALHLLSEPFPLNWLNLYLSQIRTELVLIEKKLFFYRNYKSLFEAVDFCLIANEK